MEQDPNIPSGESGLPRLLRRRRRIGRNQRRYGGKSITGWAEYSAVPVTASGDGSKANFWVYALVGIGAPLLPAVIYSVAWVAASHSAETPIWSRLGDYLPIAIMVLLPVCAFALLLIAGLRIRIWLDRREARKRQAEKNQAV